MTNPLSYIAKSIKNYPKKNADDLIPSIRDGIYFKIRIVIVHKQLGTLKFDKSTIKYYCSVCLHILLLIC